MNCEREMVKEFDSKEGFYELYKSVEHCFETPDMHVLNDAFQKLGYRVCFMAEYFLPDLQVLKAAFVRHGWR